MASQPSPASHGYIWSSFHGEQAAGGPLDIEGVAIKRQGGLARGIGLKGPMLALREGQTRLQQETQGSMGAEYCRAGVSL